jgi:hypothetical protein
VERGRLLEASVVVADKPAIIVALDRGSNGEGDSVLDVVIKIPLTSSPVKGGAGAGETTPIVGIEDTCERKLLRAMRIID